VASTVKVAEPVAEVLTAVTTSWPESWAVKVAAEVDMVVAVERVELTVVEVEALVTTGPPVVAVTLPAQPPPSNRIARRGAIIRVLFTT
jgi:hypothetical protein